MAYFSLKSVCRRHNFGDAFYKPTGGPYLVYCDIVARLLKARGVVIPVPHNNPNLVQNNSTNQLVGALNLNHDGGDIVGGLRKKAEAMS